MEGLLQIDDSSIDCVITSPPYWQLRDYGYSDQWGLEPTYQEYLEKMWDFMDEIWRVLKDTGTVWVNIGDTYSTKSGGFTYEKSTDKLSSYTNNMKVEQPKAERHKSLLMIPHRFAIGCYDRGWIIRNDIVWAKRNAMPESVVDRFSKKHEYFFFMTKKSVGYYFDLDNIKIGSMDGSNKNPGDVSDFWDIPTKGSSSNHYASYNTNLIDKPILAGCPEGGTVLDPFCGTGTTIFRAQELGREYIGIEASEEFYRDLEASKSSIDNINEQSLDKFFGGM